MVMDELDISPEEASNLLNKHQSVRESVKAYKNGNRKNQ